MSWFSQPATVVGKDYFEKHYKKMGYPMRASVDAFAEDDNLFHSQMMSDVYLQMVFQSIVEGKFDGNQANEDIHLRSALKSILRGLKVRVNFSLDQKMRILFHFQTLDKSDDRARSIIKKLKIVEKIDANMKETLAMIRKLTATFGDTLEEDVVLLERCLKCKPSDYHSAPVSIKDK